MLRTRLSCWLPLLGALALLLSLLPAVRDLPVRAAPAYTIGTLVVTGVATGNSSVKVAYQAYPGSADYRIFDAANPQRVKYAGTVYNGSVMVPSTVVEWNSLDDNAPHTLVVQAVDALGPVPPANQYTSGNQPVISPAGMLGANSGHTPDGNTSINGQGPSANTPQVIAQSAPFVVRANRAYAAIPSSPDAVQTFFDTFDTSGGQPVQAGAVDPVAGTATYTLGAGTGHPWDIRTFRVDTIDTMPFLADGHFMDMVFDGGTPGSNQPLHQSYASLSLVPQIPADLSGGKLVHLTAEVDQHVDGRRWWQWYILPHGDAFTGNNIFSGALNQSNTGLEVELTPGGCIVGEFTGPAGGGVPNQARFAGAAGQAAQYCADGIGPYGKGNGQGLDTRSRVDFFFTATHYALFVDGQRVVDGAISPPLPFTSADIYFTHYLYHSAQEVADLASRPYETYWRTVFPYSDERHWDNLGYEVLPAGDVSANWDSLKSRVALPAFVAPASVQGTATPTDTPAPPDTATSTATDTPIPPTATGTAIPPTATDTATASPTPRATSTAAPSATTAPPQCSLESIVRDKAGVVVLHTTSPYPC